MSNALKENLLKHYNSKKLNPKDIEVLSELQLGKNGYFLFDKRIIYSTLAAISLFCVLLISNISSKPTISKIAQEVSYNHKKNMPTLLVRM